MAGLTWLHLSDWHQKGEKFDYDRDVVLEKLIADIQNRKEISKDLETIDFIVFSGDVTNHGKKEEYDKAVTYLFEPVLKAAALGKERLFIVPGNHDLDRDKFDLLPATLTKYLTDDKEIKKWLTEEDRLIEMLKPFNSYTEFIKPFASEKLSSYACYFQLTKDEKKIGLMGFNSALMCGRGDDDYGKLIIGEPQVTKTLEQAKDADICIAVLHHPFEYLTIADRTTVERRLKQAAHFILCGHQHRCTVNIHGSTEGDCIIIPTGATYNRRIEGDPNYTCSYNFVHLDFEKLNGVAYLRKWNEEVLKWTKHQREDTHPDGIFVFPLPKALLPKKEKAAEPVATAPLSPISAKYDLNNPVFNLQYRAKGEGMVGREEALNKVRQQLKAGKPTAIGHTAAFQGLGGLGKTQLAVEYAYQYQDSYPKGVIWLTADQNMEAQLIDVAKQARWIFPDSKHEDILAVALQRLKTFSDCLIIFDNVENRDDIEPYLPKMPAAPHLLLTSRTVQRDFVPIPIDLLDPTLSLQLLLKEAGRNFDDLTEKEKIAAAEIATAMDGLPLAIEIAGAFLQHFPDCTFSNYQTMLTDNFNQVMAGDLLSSLTKHEQNLFHTLQVNQPVFKQAPLLQEILDLLSWSASAFMGISLMSTILEKKEGDLLFSLQMGLKLRILHKASEGNRYDIHRLLRKVRQEQFPIGERIPWVNEVCKRLGNWFEERRKEFTDLPAFEAEIDHLKEWLKHVTPHSGEHTARLTWLLAYPLFHWGKYKETHQGVLVAFGLLDKLPDADPKLKANIVIDLGYTYRLLGKYKEALKYFEQALAIRRQIFGEQHPDTATSLDNVGNAHSDLGNHNEALKYQEQALEIRRQLFGEQHSRTATSLNNVGSTHYYLENHKEALKYFEQDLEIYRQLFGEQHPNTATSLNNIGGTYFDLGEYIKALPFYKQAFEIHSKILGGQHPNTVSSLYGYAGCQMKLKQFKEAYQQVKAYLKNLPDDHSWHDKLHALLQQIDQEGRKAGFRSQKGKR